ncbi:MAG TPA: DUF488 family protein [Puia sp.]|nr:DUF488 family protein [Puia sp.]
MPPVIQIKRAYDAPAKTDGIRILVDRLWPRGITKEKAAIKQWAKDLAPSTELRQWFHHETPHWPEFEKRYKAELKQNHEAIEAFREQYREAKHLTLVYSAKDEEHNQAVVLKDYLDGLFKD